MRTALTAASQLLRLQLPSLSTCACTTLHSPDRQQVVASTDEGLIYLLHTSSLAAQLISQSHSAAVTALGYAPQASDRFATAAGDGALRVWDASNYCAVVSATVKVCACCCY
jgi:WD40 repeat protein